jgi:hypothetical protein
MRRHGKRHPVAAVAGLGRQHVALGGQVALEVALLDLQHRDVLEHLLVVGVELERVLEALDGILELALCAVHQPVHMPAHEAAHVERQAALHQLVHLLVHLAARRLLLRGHEQQPLHGQRLAVVGEGREDGIAALEALLVLLRLVELDGLLEQAQLARRQLLAVLRRRRRRALDWRQSHSAATCRACAASQHAPHLSLRRPPPRAARPPRLAAPPPARRLFALTCAARNDGARGAQMTRENGSAHSAFPRLQGQRRMASGSRVSLDADGAAARRGPPPTHRSARRRPL